MLFRLTFVTNSAYGGYDNTLHFVTKDSLWTNGDDSDDPEAVLDELDAALTTKYKAMIPTAHTLLRLSCTQVKDPNNPAQVPVIAELTKNEAGTRTYVDQDLPPQLCARIKLTTGKAGRNFRGRFFCPPLTDSSLILSGAIKTTGNFMTAANAFRAQLTDTTVVTGGWRTLWITTWSGKFVIYSRTRHRAQLSPTYEQVTGTAIPTDPSWIRSRFF